MRSITPTPEGPEADMAPLQGRSAPLRPLTVMPYRSLRLNTERQLLAAIKVHDPFNWTFDPQAAWERAVARETQHLETPWYA